MSIIGDVWDMMLLLVLSCCVSLCGVVGCGYAPSLFFVVGCCLLVRCRLPLFGFALLLRVCDRTMLCVVVRCCLCVGVGLWFVVIGVSGCSYVVCCCLLCVDVCWKVVCLFAEMC